MPDERSCTECEDSRRKFYVNRIIFFGWKNIIMGLRLFR